jgi:hypothetical protein
VSVGLLNSSSIFASNLPVFDLPARHLFVPDP